jgi:hypothetical protein
MKIGILVLIQQLNIAENYMQRHQMKSIYHSIYIFNLVNFITIHTIFMENVTLCQ